MCVSHSPGDQYRVAPVDKQQGEEDGGVVDEDDTQDPAEDEQQFGHIKDWITSHHLENFELSDVLSNFPDISVVLTEEIMDKLVKECVLSKAGPDSYSIINKQKKSDYEFDAVKEEMDGQVLPFGNKAQKGVKVGQAIYSTGSLFNHSCLPNIHAYFLSRTLYIQSTEFVAAGYPLELSYGPQVELIYA